VSNGFPRGIFPHGRQVSILGILCALCIFTYVSPVRTPFDTQPYALIMACLIIVVKLDRSAFLGLPTPLLAFFAVLFAAVISWISLGATLVGARSLAGYATTALVATAVYLVAHQRLGYMVPISSLVWLAFGTIQGLVSPDFGHQILSRLSTSENRGVTSLAVEPSMYAIVCVFLFLLNDLSWIRGEYSRRVYLTTAGCLAVQVWLAGSALGFLLVLVYLGSRAVFSGSFFRTIVRVAGAVLAGTAVLYAYLHVSALQNTRASQLISRGFESPGSFIYSDQSVAERFFALQASHQSLFTNAGVGFGLGSWADNLSEIVGHSPGLIRYSVTLQGQQRVMSGFGTAVFELGLVGLLLPAALVLVLVAIARNTALSKAHRSWGLYVGVTSLVVMECAIPLAFPLFGFILGLLVALSRNRLAMFRIDNASPATVGGTVDAAF